MTSQGRVLVYLREASESYRQRLHDDAAVRYIFCRSEGDVRAAITSADVILGSIGFPGHLLSLARKLRWVQVTGAGVDQFLESARLPTDVPLTRVDVGFGDAIGE